MEEDRSAYLDYLVDNRIGMGKYQYLMSFAIGTLFIADTCHINATGFLTLNAKLDFGAKDMELALVSSLFLTGLCIGSVITGPFTSYFGLKIPMITSAIAIAVVDLLASFAYSITSLTVIWTMMGLALGLISPLCNTMLSEVPPRPNRTFIFYATGAFFGIGNLILAGYVHVIFGGIKAGNWRLFLRLLSLVPLSSAAVIYFFLKESFRGVIIQKRVNEGVEILNHIGRMNHGPSFTPITFEEKMLVNEWVNSIYSIHKVDAGPKLLFQSPLLRITASIFVVYFLRDLIFYGFSLYMPIILQHLMMNNQLREEQGLLVICLSEFPALMIPILMIDRETFGRKGTFVLYAMLASVLMLDLYYFESKSLWLLGIMWCFAQVPSKIIPFLATEYYPTNIRAWALGFAASVGRVGALISPFITLYVIRRSVFDLFFVFGVALIFKSLAVVYLPYETRGRPLDQIIELEEVPPSAIYRATPKFKPIDAFPSAQNTPSASKSHGYQPHFLQT